MPRYRYTCDPSDPSQRVKSFKFDARDDTAARKAAERFRTKVVGTVYSEELEQGRRKGRKFISERTVFQNQRAAVVTTPQRAELFNVN